MNPPWQTEGNGIKNFECDGWTVTVWPEGYRTPQPVEVQAPRHTVIVESEPDALIVTSSVPTGAYQAINIPWPIVEAIMEARFIVAGRTL